MPAQLLAAVPRHCETNRPARARACRLSPHAQAQEFSLLARPLFSAGANTCSWSAIYRERSGRYAAWSFSWLSEGHLPNYHRDGQALQASGCLSSGNDRLDLSACHTAGGDHSNTHGWGVLGSLRAAYDFARRWIAQAQFNYVLRSAARTPLL
jgi:hypothetical protein